MWERVQVALGDPGFWKLEHCCFSWDLKAGAIISTLTGFTVIFCSLMSVTAQFQILYTDMEEEKYKILRIYQIIHYVLAYLYLVLALAAFTVTFIGAYTDNFMVTLVGTCLAGVSFVFWICLTVVSYFPPYYRIVCIQTRCPDLHYFVESRWRDFGGNCTRIYGLSVKVTEPPTNLTYPRWFTDRSYFDMTNIETQMVPLVKAYEQKHKKGRLINLELVTNTPETYHPRSKIGQMSAILSKKINKTGTIRNKNRSKVNRLKRKKKKRKKHRKKKNFKRKYQRDDYEGEEDVYPIKDEDEQPGGDQDNVYQEEGGANIGDFIPLFKLAPPVEIIFKGVSILLATLWAAFMTNTLIVLIYYVNQLYNELPVWEEGEEYMTEI